MSGIRSQVSGFVDSWLYGFMALWLYGFRASGYLLVLEGTRWYSVVLEGTRNHWRVRQRAPFLFNLKKVTCSSKMTDACDFL